MTNNNNNIDNSPASSAIGNPAFALAYARAYCTQLLQSYVNSSSQLTATTQNQPSLTANPPTYSSPSQYTSLYPFQQLQQQPSQSSNTPTQQYPYQSPYQYPYQQQQPYLYTNQQQQQQQSPTISNGATAPVTPQLPYQNSYPYQQLQNQSSSASLGTNPGQYPYQQQQSSQPFAAGGQPAPPQSNLVVVTHINYTIGVNNNPNNGNSGSAAGSNFTQIVENAYTNPDGYTYVYHYMKSSEAGVTVGLQPGTFGVFVLSNNTNIKANTAPSTQSNYDISYSGDCRVVKSITGGAAYGYGTINPGETKTCIVTLSLHK
jgi:hypothetical protein